MRRRSGWVWTGRIAAVVVFAGLGAYLASVGLDKADKLASALGLLVAVAALVAPYLTPSSDGDDSERKPVQQVADTVVGGHLTQVRSAKGVRVQGQTLTVPPHPPPLAGTSRSPEGQSGQYVNGGWVGGNLTQVDDANGDITIG
jgi:hypothetical protein